MTMIRHLLVATIGFAALTTATNASAAVTINIVQVGTDVIASGGGSINVTGLRFVGMALTLPGEIDGLRGTSAFFSTGTTTGANENVFTGFTGPVSFGPGTAVFNSTSTTGGRLGINSTGINGGQELFLPSGYVSGSTFTTGATFSNRSLATMGLNAGSYTFFLPSDTITVIINTVAAVPEPTTWMMMLAGFGLMGAALRYRGRATNVACA